mmetsp:Transcript_43931/g.145498  ORF Transcript_43931/g.145498 Transcript_43931/m.145498 type:complete len:421 (-) Transcript_43931:2405-3667(-)
MGRRQLFGCVEQRLRQLHLAPLLGLARLDRLTLEQLLVRGRLGFGRLEALDCARLVGVRHPLLPPNPEEVLADCARARRRVAQKVLVPEAHARGGAGGLAVRGHEVVAGAVGVDPRLLHHAPGGVRNVEKVAKHLEAGRDAGVRVADQVDVAGGGKGFVRPVHEVDVARVGRRLVHEDPRAAHPLQRLVHAPRRAVGTEALDARASLGSADAEQLHDRLDEPFVDVAHLWHGGAFGHRVKHEEVELLPGVEHRIRLQAELQQRGARAWAAEDKEDWQRELGWHWRRCAKDDRGRQEVDVGRSFPLPTLLFAIARRGGGVPLDCARQHRNRELLSIREQVLIAHADANDLLHTVPQLERRHRVDARFHQWRVGVEAVDVRQLLHLLEQYRLDLLGAHRQRLARNGRGLALARRHLSKLVIG